MNTRRNHTRAHETYVEGLANPVSSLSLGPDKNNLLPFLDVSLHQEFPIDGETGTQSFCLVDSGATRNMINQNFYYKHFPNGVLEHTNVILKYAAEGPGDAVNYSSKLFIKIKVDGGIMVLRQPFLLVPNIRFDVYLGQTFISSEDFGLYHPKFIVFNPSRSDYIAEIEHSRRECGTLPKARLEYFSKDTYNEASRRKQREEYSEK